MRNVGFWAVVSLAVAALMVAEATLQFGGRSAAVTVCMLGPVVWATALVCSRRRLQPR